MSTPPEVPPLEMARNAARNVLAYADAQERDPLQSHVHRFGERGHQAAELAANLALVSIAEDLHLIAQRLAGDSRPAPAADENNQDAGAAPAIAPDIAGAE